MPLKEALLKTAIIVCVEPIGDLKWSRSHKHTATKHTQFEKERLPSINKIKL